MRKLIPLLLGSALALSACGSGADAGEQESAASGETAAVAKIPDSLAPFGNGYPADGDACRRLGESPATSNFLDDSAALVGCPDAESAAALGGKLLGVVEGVTLVSVPMGDANTGITGMAAPVAGDGDALVPGTQYHATAQVPCAVGGAEPTANCPAGVIRQWGEDGTTLVEVTKPDGRKRAIFFRGTTPYGADSAQSDGSAGWDFNVTRRGDQSVIAFGPETYIVVDAFVEGG